MDQSETLVLPDPESPVLRGLSGPRSAVSRPDRPWTLVLAVAGLAILGVIVFSSLSQDRAAHANAPMAPAPLARPATPTPPPSAPAMAQSPARMPAPTPGWGEGSGGLAGVTAEPVDRPDPSVRWRAPAMVIDIGGDAAPSTLAMVEPIQPGAGQASAPASASTSAPVRPSSPALSADEQFDERMSSATVETASATRLRDTALIAPQGTVIPAVMETAINLDLPGFARAVVSRDVRGFDGSTVLIPRGSRLIGQYRAGVAAGQSRAFVVWSRVLTPQGVSVDISSPGADRLGRSGVEGETNTHFFRRFGNSILLSVLSAGLEASSGGTATSIVIGSQQQASNMASIALQKEIDIPDTVTVAQGTPIRVFIARDLDFSGAMRKAP